MLYFKKGNKFKQMNFEDIESLKKKLNVERIQEEEKFMKLINKSENIYGYYDPYSNEINEESVMSWELTEEKALDSYYLSSEEI